MRKLVILFVLFLIGCKAVPVVYEPSTLTNQKLASQIIEQVIMEQPKKHRSTEMLIDDEFIVFGEGLEYKGKTSSVNLPTSDISSVSIASETGTVKNVSERIYFNSLMRIELFHKRDWYIIQLISDEEYIVKRFYTRNKIKAEKFIDAMNSYMINSTKFSEY